MCLGTALNLAGHNSRAQSRDPGDESQDAMDDEDNPPQHSQSTLSYAVPFLDEAERSAINPISPQRSQRSMQHDSHNQIPSNPDIREHIAVDMPAPLPRYIRPLPSHLTRRDIEYLVERDAFTIPDDEFRDALLRTYVRIIHCFMPAIDLDALLIPVIKGNGSISLLLFQAVMFASVIFVDSEFLRSRGYSSRKAARKIFFNRVRLLYGLDCERDQLTLVQALLLMTYWYDSPNDEKDTWYWMGITLSLTQVLGLHRDPKTLKIGIQEKRRRKRIWWSCYIRDRLIALGIRRPARIREDEYHVSMLELDDFTMEEPTPEVMAFIIPFGYTMMEADKRREMYQMCIELARLCVCIGEILQSQYSVVRNASFNYEPYKNVAVLPRDVEQQTSELIRCDTMLEEWHRNQKASCRYSPPSDQDAVVGNSDEDWVLKTTWLHQALLRMVYLTAVGALHRPRALTTTSLPIGSEVLDNNTAKKASMEKVKEAAVAMTKLAFDLQSENYLRFLSTSSVPAFLSATLIHLLDVRDGDEGIRNLAIGRFYQCFHALYELQDMYSSAYYAIRFLRTVLKGMKTTIPMLGTLRIWSNAIKDKTHDSALRYENTTSNFESHNVSLDMYAPASPGIGAQYPISSAMRVFGSDINPNARIDMNPQCNFPDLQTTNNADFGARIDEISNSLSFRDLFADGVPHVELWNGIDGLLPALIPFDTETQSTSTNQARPF